MKIVPAIIAKNFEELEKKVKLVEPYVSWVQLDVMDGKFTLEKSWDSPEELKNLNTKLDIEAHLMVEDVEGEVNKWLDSGVKRILAHIEPLAQSSKLKAQSSNLQLKVQSLIEKCNQNGIEFGLALNLETPIEVLNKFQVSGFRLQVIQLMSIAKIGHHGELFDARVIPKIKALREMFPNVKISVDGGINQKSARLVAEAGADIFVVGSAIFGSKNISETIKEFKDIN